jgi:hypothetical protein
MRSWLLLLLSLGALALAALFALPKLVSDCAHESPLPSFGIAAFFLLAGAGAGIYLSLKGDVVPRTILFGATIVILLGYGLALSMILPMVLQPGCLPMR